MSPKKRKEAEQEFEGKSPEDIKEQIRAIKKEMRSIMDKMECPGDSLEPIMTRSGHEELRICRERLASAKEALRSAGGIYMPDEEDIRSAELLDNLPFFTKMTFEIGGYFGGYKTYIIEKENASNRDGSSTYYEDDGITGIGEPVHTTILSADAAEKLIDLLKEMHIDEWMPDYWPDRFGMSVMDGTQWSLKIDFGNGHDTWESSGSNSYPYNFSLLRMLFDPFAM